MKLSVIIPCRNEKEHIGPFLESVLAQELDPGWEMEVLLVDGMSNDGTIERLAERKVCAANVQLIYNPSQIVSAGLNAGIAVSTGDIVLRMDVHTTYAPDYVRQCAKVLQETNADSVGGPWVARGRGFLGQAIAAAFRSSFCMGGGKSHNPDYEGEVDTVYLGCWRRSVFAWAGLFDTALVRNQDDEFHHRLRRLGGKIWQSPRIKSSYTPRASISRLFRQYLQYGFWRIAVIRKHRSLASWRHVVPGLFIAWILLSLAGLVLTGTLNLPAFATLIGIALAVGLGVYILACIVASVPFARSVPPLALVMLPGVIAIHHIAYGLGEVLGVFKLVRNAGRVCATDEVFTTLTR